MSLANDHQGEADWDWFRVVMSVQDPGGEGLSRPKPQPTTVMPCDVLLGRGKRNQQHPGNVQFLDKIKEYSDLYQRQERGEKHRIVEQVLDWVFSRRGRFLKLNCGGYWVKARNAVIKDKVAQAFRRHQRLSSARLDKKDTRSKAGRPRPSKSLRQAWPTRPVCRNNSVDPTNDSLGCLLWKVQSSMSTPNGLNHLHATGSSKDKPLSNENHLVTVVSGQPTNHDQYEYDRRRARPGESENGDVEGLCADSQDILLSDEEILAALND